MRFFNVYLENLFNTFDVYFRIFFPLKNPKSISKVLKDEFLLYVTQHVCNYKYSRNYCSEYLIRILNIKGISGMQALD